MLIDTHCHLDFSQFDADREQVIKQAKDQGIGYIINIGSTVASSRRSVELSKKYDCIYATVGIHPHDADGVKEGDVAPLRDLARNDKVVAIGEIGLDYFKNYSQADNQRKLFVSLINLAKDIFLPIVVHTRQAEEDTLKILKGAMPLKAVVHCFSGDKDFLNQCLDLGFFISFTCNITYKKAVNLREIVKLTPLDRLLLETDAPYLSCEGFRGKRNEPMNVRLLAQEIAKIKEVNPDEVASTTSLNAIKFFNLG